LEVDMTTWVDALRQSRARPPAPGFSRNAPVTATWLAALALDDRQLPVEDVMSGTTVLLARSERLRRGVEMLVDAVIGPAAARAGRLPPAGSLLVVAQPLQSPEWQHDAAEAGSAAIALAAETDDVVPAEARHMADRVIRLDDRLDRAGILCLVTLVTGGIPALPADLNPMHADDLIAAVHSGATAEDCASRIRRLVAARAGDPPDLPTPADPSVVVPPSAGAVRRLSEMSGFGEAGEWGMRLAADLQDYRDGTLPWADVDRGILLSGPPGCGKTTFASALAEEAEVDLVATTYSDWHGGSGGDSVTKGLSKLFETWRKRASKNPIILLIDEIDSIGARGGNGHNDSWFAPMINSWLAFLDGAVPRDGIVVIAATNHPERVDPALLRPGRLDRHVALPLPEVAALRGVVRHHLGADADDAGLDRAARACRGMSPASVAQACREARRLARVTLHRPVAADDVAAVLGARREEALRLPGARDLDRRVAIHEAGHALAILGSDVETLMNVDLDAGLTQSARRRTMTLADVEGRLTILLAGLAAEQALLGSHANGSTADLREATAIAIAAHAEWGMGALGYRVAPLADAMWDRVLRDAVDAILGTAHARASAMVEASRVAVGRLADRLQRDRYLDADEARAALEGTVPPAPEQEAPVRTAGRRRAPAPGF